MGFIDLESIYIVGHLIGVALGAGGAFVSDAIFFRCIKDRILSNTELNILKTVSYVVWTGIGVLLITGGLLFSLDYTYYLSSGGFLAKMTIVAVIIANGILFHYSHIPRMVRNQGKPFASSEEFMHNGPFLMASGAVSVISWLSVIVLGSLHNVSFTYGLTILVYLLLLLIGVGSAIAMRKHFLG